MGPRTWFGHLQVTGATGVAAGVLWSTHPEGCRESGVREMRTIGQMATMGTVGDTWTAREERGVAFRESLEVKLSGLVRLPK